MAMRLLCERIGLCTALFRHENIGVFTFFLVSSILVYLKNTQVRPHHVTRFKYLLKYDDFDTYKIALRRKY